jgi:hypothetical protein
MKRQSRPPTPARSAYALGFPFAFAAGRFMVAFFTFGLSFSGLGDVLIAPLRAASKRAWASFSEKGLSDGVTGQKLQS